ncbi:hypothetical protein GCM10009410_26980 [Shewanella ulleungensis]|uniref:Transposase n=1 Tax=Shewanella ulleungensis TaxID=2282699 RepID=A0ABQ2QTB9_9GAMM|nr:hypothetical protein GCM10009410_26980 [Shewanella ulleungensis]
MSKRHNNSKQVDAQFIMLIRVKTKTSYDILLALIVTFNTSRYTLNKMQQIVLDYKDGAYTI